MKTITTHTQVFTFAELSESAQEKAIQNLCDINMNYEWWDSTYDDAETAGLKLTAFDLDRNRHAEGKFITSARECAESIIGNHGDACETFKTAQAFLKDWRKLEDSYNHDQEMPLHIEHGLQDLEAEFLKSILEDYSIILQKEYEYLTSREAVEETIEANDYHFTENGELA